jgi:hypothetical protein
MDRSSVSARCSELKTLGYVTRKKIGERTNGEFIFERRRTRSGRSAAVLVFNAHANY